ncbi:hypothetical protein D3C75_962190 [compost metagenome]
MALLHQAAGVQAQCQRAFGIGLLLQQHAPYVRVFDDAHLRCQGVLVPGESTLRSFAGVIQGVIETLAGQRGSGERYADASLVHHLEHVAKTFMRLTYQVTDRAALFTKTEYG